MRIKEQKRQCLKLEFTPPGPEAHIFYNAGATLHPCLVRSTSPLLFGYVSQGISVLPALARSVQYSTLLACVGTSCYPQYTHLCLSICIRTQFHVQCARTLFFQPLKSLFNKPSYGWKLTARSATIDVWTTELVQQ